MTAHKSGLCHLCRGSCRCPCWGGHSINDEDAGFTSGSENSESELSEPVAQSWVMRRRKRKKARGGGAFNPYGGEGPRERKRIRVESTDAVNVAAPVVPSAYPEIVAPAVPLVATPGSVSVVRGSSGLRSFASVAGPSTETQPQVASVSTVQVTVGDVIISYAQDAQVDFPIETIAGARVFLAGLCQQGRKGRVTYRAFAKFSDVPERNVSLFVRGELNPNGELHKTVGMKILEAVNRPYQEALLADDNESEGSLNSSENPGEVWERWAPGMSKSEASSEEEPVAPVSLNPEAIIRIGLAQREQLRAAREKTAREKKREKKKKR